MNSFDAVVIGGGLAGSCAAINLAKRGLSVALLEAGSFPRHKVCGEFLSPEARPVLRRLGVEAELLEKGAREVSLTRLVLGNDFLEVPLPSPALAVSRLVLDEVLWRRARQSGAHCLEKTRVRGWQKQDKFCVQTAKGEFQSPGLIEASGRSNTHQNKARFLGLKTHWHNLDLQEGVTELHVFEGGYCGLVRVESDLTNVCLLVRYEMWQRSGGKSPQEFFEQILQQCPLLARRIARAELAHSWLATGNVQFDAANHENVGLSGILQCGDAARFIHPFTGDGMAMALRAGELAGATLAARSNEDDASLLFAGAWRRQFRARLNWAGALAPLFLQPTAARVALQVTRTFPALAPFLVAKTRS
jgi:flavin-dependent dehydrogenase